MNFQRVVHTLLSVYHILWEKVCHPRSSTLFFLSVRHRRERAEASGESLRTVSNDEEKVHKPEKTAKIPPEEKARPLVLPDKGGYNEIAD